MSKNELFLKTLFCCSACDGDIAKEEVALVKALCTQSDMFSDLNVDDILNQYIVNINEKDNLFLKNYLAALSMVELTNDEQLTLVDLAIKMIEADNQILYSEIKFFKKIRSHLSVSDEAILNKRPDVEDFLLPDIAIEDKDFENIGNFAPISFSLS